MPVAITVAVDISDLFAIFSKRIQRQENNVIRDIIFINIVWSWQVCRLQPLPKPFSFTLPPFPYLFIVQIILLERKKFTLTFS